VIAYAMYGWSQAPKRIKVDIPPDLRTGSSRGIEERHPYNVYGFGLYIWQQLNNWPVAGEKDYSANISRLACYITPRFQAELKRDLDQKGRRAELARTRALQEMFDRPYEPKRVWVESGESWVAYYDVSIKETYRGETVKDIFVRYPIRIVRWDTDAECNPWGLALDGFYEEPVRLEQQAKDRLAARQEDNLS
jgi:integrating conjugative element protein (TIGR03746 family)